MMSLLLNRMKAIVEFITWILNLASIKLDKKSIQYNMCWRGFLKNYPEIFQMSNDLRIRFQLKVFPSGLGTLHLHRCSKVWILEQVISGKMNL